MYHKQSRASRAKCSIISNFKEINPIFFVTGIAGAIIINKLARMQETRIVEKHHMRKRSIHPQARITSGDVTPIRPLTGVSQIQDF